jgi:hypothetical protein
MAKSKNLFSVSGKVGNVVFYERFGKTYVRTKPVYIKRKNKTEGQLITQKRFKLASKIIRSLLPLIRKTYKEVKETGSPYHKAIGQTIQYAFRGETAEELSLDIRFLPIAYGSLSPLNSLKVQESEEKTNRMELQWDAGMGDSLDQLCFIQLGHKANGEFVGMKHFETEILRKDGLGVFDVNQLWNFPKAYLFAYFKNEKKGKNSPSSFIKEFDFE